MMESSTLVVGGGAVEAALSVYLEDYAETLGTREQLAIQEFADALLFIPKTLAVNAAKDSSDLVVKLGASHANSKKRWKLNRPEDGKESDSSGFESFSNTGLDLVKGIICGYLTAGVVEPAISKIKSLIFATEAELSLKKTKEVTT